MRTLVPTAGPDGVTVERQWHVIDAEGQVLGRVATEAAKLLQVHEAQLLMAAGDISRVRAAPLWRPVSPPQ